MRRFYVWLDRGVPGEDAIRSRVELPDETSDEACEAACRCMLEVLIGNELDTGWDELKDGEAWPEGCE